MSQTDNSGTTTPEETTTTTPEKDDPIRQLKGEFNRKIGDTHKLIEQMAETNAQLTAKLDAIINPKPKPNPADAPERLMYTDPQRYSQIIKEQAKQEALETMRAETQGQNAIQSRVASLASEYPELADNTSDLTKASVELLKAANSMQKNDPNFYEYAVLKAANSLGVQPRSKRPRTEDDFVPASHSSPQGRSKRKTDETIVKEGKDSAQAFGLDISTPEKQKRYVDFMKKKGLA